MVYAYPLRQEYASWNYSLRDKTITQYFMQDAKEYPGSSYDCSWNQIENCDVAMLERPDKENKGRQDMLSGAE
ncbi:hypothetical protein N7451_005843 [Penicillium sp. IBT 35674x]|nr:hypothetical protein N7451_005843 [Penicillium sp. IBT 35674x]